MVYKIDCSNLGYSVSSDELWKCLIDDLAMTESYSSSYVKVAENSINNTWLTFDKKKNMLLSNAVTERDVKFLLQKVTTDTSKECNKIIIKEFTTVSLAELKEMSSGTCLIAKPLGGDEYRLMESANIDRAIEVIKSQPFCGTYFSYIVCKDGEILYKVVNSSNIGNSSLISLNCAKPMRIFHPLDVKVDRFIGLHEQYMADKRILFGLRVLTHEILEILTATPADSEKILTEGNIDITLFVLYKSMLKRYKKTFAVGHYDIQGVNKKLLKEDEGEWLRELKKTLQIAIDGVKDIPLPSYLENCKITLIPVNDKFATLDIQ